VYAFQPRFPVDHVLMLVRLLRSGEYERGKVLMLSGAILGEIGALLQTGEVFVQLDDDIPETFEECLAELEAFAAAFENGVMEDSNFDPTPWIPLLLKFIELWMKRKG